MTDLSISTTYPRVAGYSRPISCTADVIVVGAGPAGLAAASTAAQDGLRVILVDDNPMPGGQIWRGASTRSPISGSWLRATDHPNIRLMLGTRIFHTSAERPLTLFAESDDHAYRLEAENVILATGGRERFIPFPGWTLPNVMGVGGLQALAKGGYPIIGQRIVLAGSGPLLLAVAAYLRTHGAQVLLIAEQAPWRKVARFGLSLIEQPGKLLQAVQIQASLVGVPYELGCWVTGVVRDDSALLVTIRQGKRQRTIDANIVAVGYHLVPNLELGRLLGCTVKDGAIVVDDYQSTSQPGVFCAGEGTGIGGVDLALVEGQIAGHAAAKQASKALGMVSRRHRLRSFADRLNAAFAPGEGLKALATADTLICRCEDVPLSYIQRFGGWREAKLQTRCGMGACQGRVCGAALNFVLNWEVDSPRPPVFPARLASLAAIADNES